MAVLTPDDLAFFRENGYLLVREIIPEEDCEAVVAAIFDFLRMDPNRPEDWYRAPLPKGGMTEMYQHPALWKTRQNPRLYEAFTQILGTHRLWVSIDRVNFKPPRHPDHPEYDHKGFLHVDADLTVRPVGNWVQGVLYLTDTAPDQGGFQCVPGRHKFLRAWVENNPPDAELPDLQPEKAIPIPGKAGDFVIWDGLLPHGNGQNLADRPRFAQFISMYPAEYGSEEERQKRIRDWQEREPPGGRVFPGDPRRIEQQFGQTAALTPLGRKLLGIDAWE